MGRAALKLHSHLCLQDIAEIPMAKWECFCLSSLLSASLKDLSLGIERQKPASLSIHLFRICFCIPFASCFFLQVFFCGDTWVRKLLSRIIVGSIENDLHCETI